MVAESAAKHCMHGAAQASEVTWFMVRSRKGALMPHKVRVEEGARDSIPGDAEGGGCGMNVGDCLIPSAEAEEWRELVDMVAGGRKVTDEDCFCCQDLWAEREGAPFCVTICANNQCNATPAGLRNVSINLTF